jgi:hypothetical protein
MNLELITLKYSKNTPIFFGIFATTNGHWIFSFKNLPAFINIEKRAYRKDIEVNFN